MRRHWRRVTDWLHSEVGTRLMSTLKFVSLLNGLFKSGVEFVAKNAVMLGATGLAGLSVVTSAISYAESQSTAARLATTEASVAANSSQVTDELRPLILTNAENLAFQAADAAETARIAAENAANSAANAADIALTAEDVDVVQSAASRAQSSADLADVAAAEADEAADAAQSAADTAQAAADALPSSIESAQSSADDANAGVGRVEGDLADVETAVIAAQETAEAAQETADSAQASADTAQASADQAAAAASVAQGAADQAQTAAESAQTTADDATTAATTAQTAADTAQAAADTAQAAAETVGGDLSALVSSETIPITLPNGEAIGDEIGEVQLGVWTKTVIDGTVLITGQFVHYWRDEPVVFELPAGTLSTVSAMLTTRNGDAGFDGVMPIVSGATVNQFITDRNNALNGPSPFSVMIIGT